MGRHSQNNTDKAVFTYHERQEAAKNNQYGTTKQRLGKESFRDIDSCCLTLQPARSPVITPEGFLFDKEAILEYYLERKKRIEQATREYERAEAAKEQSAVASQHAVSEEEVKKFEEQEESILYRKAKESKAEEKMPFFWVPSLTPNAERVVEKPDAVVRCPMSGKPLRLKKLIPVHFTPISDEKDALRKKSGERYVCPLLRRPISNHTECVVLRPSGKVVAAACIKAVLSKDMTDPFAGKKISKKDIIPLRREGTGYAAGGPVEAKSKLAPTMIA